MKKRRIQIGRYYHVVRDSRWADSAKGSIIKILSFNPKGDGCKILTLDLDKECVIPSLTEIHISYIGKEITKKKIEKIKSAMLAEVVAHFHNKMDSF